MSKATIRKTAEWAIIVLSAYLLGWFQRETFETVNQVLEAFQKSMRILRGNHE